MLVKKYKKKKIRQGNKVSVEGNVYVKGDNTADKTCKGKKERGNVHIGSEIHMGKKRMMLGEKGPVGVEIYIKDKLGMKSLTEKEKEKAALEEET